MTHRLSTLLIIACVVLFASCGEGHHAKRLVENFMKDDMGVADYSVVSWTKLDSTFRVNDSVLTSMHQQALSEKLVRQQPHYAQPTTKPLRISLKYAVDKDTLTNTFYLDEKLQGVVGVKRN